YFAERKLMGEPPTWGSLIHRGFDPENLTHVGLNESPYPPSPRVIEAISAAAARSNRYPDHASRLLKESVARRTGIEESRQVWGAGASDMILRSLRIAAHEDHKVIAPTPSFWGYERQYMACRTAIRRIPILADGHMDLDAMLGAVTERTALMIIVTPGNPSGSLLDEAGVIRLAREVPDHVLVLVDEVYQEFSQIVGGPDVLALMGEHRDGPWINLRSFSKAYSLAGIRVGYGLCSAPEIAASFDLESNNFSLSNLSLAAAYAAFEDQDYSQDMLGKVTEQRDALSRGLKDLGLDPMPSYANFVSVPTQHPNGELLGRLLDLGVVASAWHGEGYEKHMRFTIGTEKDTRATLAALDTALKSNH
ncbi:MAG: histidinol-phosphate transaminase, partial [Rhodospirillales bacterium]|nr:histidinol-phosphate transaminase [Rhodospirillales bacterium]